MIQMCTVLCVLLIPSVIAEAADPVNVGSSKQLFIDDAMIASSQRIELNMNRPARTGVATIKGDRPWEQAATDAK